MSAPISTQSTSSQVPERDGGAPAAARRADSPVARGYRGPDRRRGPTPRFSRFAWLGGRRRAGRRGGETENSFVDQYSGRMWLFLVWIAVMNGADSFFTIYHLQNGGVEINPVADLMLTTGRVGFVVLKSVLIALPLIVLCVHKNFALARAGLWIAAATYTLLFLYHLSLL
jgi:hypothetical protein